MEKSKKNKTKEPAKVVATTPPAIPSDSNIHIELTKELYRTFDFMNDRFCDNKLPRPVITIATKGRVSAHGWFAHDMWKINDETKLHEIQMSGESLNRSYIDTIGTLVHEMAHIKNFVDNDNKVVDNTAQQRHNKIFKKTAEFFRLTVTSSKRFGFAHTTPDEGLIRIINEDLKPRLDLYHIYRESFNETKEKKTYGKLKPVMVDEETKNMIEKGAEELGMTQKEFTQKAAQLFVSLQKKADELGFTIFDKRKIYKSAAEVTVDILDGLNETITPSEEDVEEGELAETEA